MATSISFVGLSCFLLSLCLVVCSLKEGYAFEELRESHAAESYLTHTFEVSSLFASSVCNHSTKANERGSTFKIIDKYGPCFEPNRSRTVPPPSLTEILRSDRARMNSIHARLSNKNSSRRDMIELNAASIPVIDGSTFRTPNFLVKVGFGTPIKELSLVLDTGSDLTWTQCQPCETCYKQTEPLFNRTESSTYATIPKTDAICKYVTRPGTVPPNAASLCYYGIEYGDDSVSTGFFSKETVTLSTDKITGFLFGCGTYQKGEFDLEAGMMGLSQEEASIVTQTAQKYSKIFSYCLPSSASSTGHLTFGSQSLPSKIIYTKLVNKKIHYGLDLIGIGLGGKKLNISESVFTTPGTIIDSGTVFTYLPPEAYPTFRDAFREAMSAYPRAPDHDGLDTCYDLSKTTSVKVPEISFFFKDGEVVGMPGKSSLVTYSKTNSLVCLGFSGFEEGDEETIIGNQVQRTVEVVYDVARQRIGFSPEGCT